MESVSTIRFPSPTVFLRSPVIQAKDANLPPANNVKRKPATARPRIAKPKTADGVVKPKQSKSRNGCITCKAKRLKCDETKPTCQQCHKRGVECGGFKKDYKWRPFEEMSFTNKPAAPPRTKRASFSVKKEPIPEVLSPTVSDMSGSTVTPQASSAPPQVLQFPSPTHESSIEDTQLPFTSIHNPHHVSGVEISVMTTASTAQNPSIVTSPKGMTISTEDHQGPAPAVSGSSPGQSPRLMDLLLSSPDVEYMDFRKQQDDTNFNMENYQPGMEIPMDRDEEEDDAEEIPRQEDDITSEDWLLTHGSFTHFNDGDQCQMFDISSHLLDQLLQQPKLSPSSPEMLLSGFDRSTCGILSVRDGPTENPWRTMILPLIHESPALFHAISSMTAFHLSKRSPEVKYQGIQHMRESIKLLAQGIRNMRVDIAMAVTLALAFAESWDVHVSTGIKHLQGAQTLMKSAIDLVRQLGPDNEISTRIKFLCNTWVYMDVIARLTSVDSDDTDDFYQALWFPHFDPFSGGEDIDPLMGCASTLFPLVGRVANLVRRVRRSSTNSMYTISEANELKAEIERWQPPNHINEPEDEKCDIRDSRRTGEAYRWATLLYLHQAVPEIPSRSSGQLAKKALIALALVPISSRNVIIQIYPLLAAGCEASTREDRQWVQDRWIAMSRRMQIGNIDRCLEVVKEVWERRDRHSEEALLRQASRQRSSTETMFSPTVSSFGHSRTSSSDWGLSGVENQLFADESMDELSSALDAQDLSSFWNQASSSRRGQSSSQDEGAFVHWSNRREINNGSIPRGNPDSMSPATRRQSRDDSLEVREELYFERSVRGKHHWVGVMMDWSWEILLG